MCRIEGRQAAHACIITGHKRKASACGRITDAYHNALHRLSEWLFKKELMVPFFMTGALLGEPKETFKSAFRRIAGWKSSWKKHGFYNADSESSLKKLKATLADDDSRNDLTPVLLFHGLYSTPDIWYGWSDALQKAQKKGKIGHVITVQLSNDMEKRMEKVNRVIKEITGIYEKQGYKKAQVDLIGHSLGGYAAHLAAFKKVQIKDKNGVLRRWHNKHKRNKRVRTVISVSAPTWLCCKGQCDKTSPLASKKEDIYPWNIFSRKKKVSEAFTKRQLKTIRKNHEGIYDIVPSRDMIRKSPLPKRQVYRVRHGHIGAATCPKVCKLAVKILSTQPAATSAR